MTNLIGAFWKIAFGNTRQNAMNKFMKEITGRGKWAQEVKWKKKMNSRSYAVFLRVI
jgi:hypothetical protein